MLSHVGASICFEWPLVQLQLRPLDPRSCISPTSNSQFLESGRERERVSVSVCKRLLLSLSRAAPELKITLAPS